MADLDHAAGGATVSGPHALGMLHREGHGLLDVDVLARLERGHEVLAVQVLGRGDDDRVHAGLLEQVAVVEIGPGRGASFLASSSRRV